MKRIFCCILGLLFLVGITIAHSGRKDGSGCHNCNVAECNYERHCHNNSGYESKSTNYDYSDYRTLTRDTNASYTNEKIFIGSMIHKAVSENKELDTETQIEQENKITCRSKSTFNGKECVCNKGYFSQDLDTSVNPFCVNAKKYKSLLHNRNVLKLDKFEKYISKNNKIVNKNKILKKLKSKFYDRNLSDQKKNMIKFVYYTLMQIE